ncbi:MAG: heme o synthase [Verrucomicrobiota bacterium]
MPATTRLHSWKEEASALFSDLSVLVKARLTALVLVTTAAGFALGKPESTSWWMLVSVVFGTGLVAGGAGALNQLLEVDPDSKMNRTQDRPLPSRRFTQENALFLGALLTGLGISYLVVSANYLTGFIAALTMFIYVFVYTPLKKVTTANTVIGAIPGALPPVIGWTAATDSLGPMAFILFMIQVLWQMPHFYAIGWICRDDYARGNYRMLAVEDESGKRSALYSMHYAGLLVLVCLLPTLIGLAGWIYGILALIVSAYYFWKALQFYQNPQRESARSLFLTSLLYLPVIFIPLLLNSRI